MEKVPNDHRSSLLRGMYQDRRSRHSLSTVPLIREMFGWYGTKPSTLRSICSTMSGEIVPKSWWITA